MAVQARFEPIPKNCAVMEEGYPIAAVTLAAAVVQSLHVSVSVEAADGDAAPENTSVPEWLYVPSACWAIGATSFIARTKAIFCNFSIAIVSDAESMAECRVAWRVFQSGLQHRDGAVDVLPSQ